MGASKLITVAGRHVRFHDRGKLAFYVAKWETGAARYTALADGATPATLKKFIACLP
jgi:hypothetical protein